MINGLFLYFYICIFLLIIVICFFIKKMWSYKKCTESVQAIITKKLVNNRRGGADYFLTFVFNYLNNEYTIKTSHFYIWLKEGDFIDIKIDPNNPQNTTIDKKYDIILHVFLMLLLILVIYLLYNRIF